MKIVLTTYGSRGDVQPMLALALALQAAGQDVLLAGPPEKAAWARELDCPYVSIGSDVTDYIDGMQNAHSPASALRFIGLVRREIVYQLDTFPRLVAGADLVIGASLVFGLSTVAEMLSIPYRYVCFTPQLLPSRHHPFMAFKQQRFPHWYNRWTWWIEKTADRFNLGGLINRHRRQLGLPLVRDIWTHILGTRGIVASDEFVAPIPADARGSFTQTGYLHLQQPHRRLASLESFLGNGPPPVYAGFGSMPVRDQARNLSLIVEAARCAGRRVIISKFWSGTTPYDRADDVFFIRHYPHLKLFPRTSAIIHHGGAGTTASGIFSGVPQIIVPHILDQYYWGDRIQRAGLGPRPIWRTRLTKGRLARAIAQSTTDKRMHKKVQEASQTARRKDSLGLAVRTLLQAGVV